MANKVAFEVIVTSKGFKVVESQQKKLGQNIDNTEKKTKKLDKTQQKNYGRQKQGVIQTANQTKNFSKLSQTIGGSGGTSLVGAYATLAANVFAASAAFNALSRAAEFQKLREGLEIVGNQSGRTLSILADNLREATSMALTLEEASSAAAIGISGGFGEVELEGLARVAKGAALTLGRSLPDAFDRLTRGAIKLEPEILDELGIMVRLDDAVEKYAATLGKSASSLTQMERRTAFMNEILEQGTAKFGDIADAADSTPYQKLGATFGDLTKTIFTFFNESLFLNDIINVLANSTTALFGTMLLFGSTIATQVVPALGTMGQKASARAADASAQAKVLAAQTKAEVAQLEAKRKSFKLGGVAYTKSVKLQKKGTVDLTASIRKLEIQEKARIAGLANQTKMTNTTIALRTKELKVIQAQIATEKRLQVIRAQASKQQIASSLSRIDAIFQKKTSKTLTKFTSGEIGMGEAMRRNGIEFDKKAKRQKKALKNAGSLTKTNEFLKRSFGRLGTTLSTLSAGFVKFLPVIAAVTIAVGLAMLAFDRFYNTEERKAYNKSMKELGTILDGMPDKAKAYNKALSAAGPASALQLRSSAILSNQISEITEKMNEAIQKRNELGESGVGTGDAASMEFNQRSGGAASTLFNDMTGGISIGGETVNKELNELERVLNSRLPALAENSKQALSTFFDISKSAEVTTLTSLLNSKIPAYAKAASDSLKPFNDMIAAGDAEGALKAAENIVDNLEKKFGDLNGAISGFATALKDAEKVGSQFVQKFLPKTSTTDIINAFSSFEKGIKSITEQSEIAFGTKGVEELSASFSATGASIGTLLGGTFLNAQKEFNLAKAELDRASADLQKEVDGKLKKGVDADGNKVDRTLNVETARNELLFQQVELAEIGTKAFADTKKQLILMNKQEVERKGTLEKIKSLKQIEKSIQGKSVDAGKIQNTILKEELQLRKDIANVGNLILADTLGVTDAEIKAFGVVQALKFEKESLLQQGGKELQISKIDLQLQEHRNILLNEALNSAKMIANVGNAGVAVRKSQLKVDERIAGFSAKLLATEEKIVAIKLGLKDTNAIAKLQAEIKAEENKIKFATEKAEIELTSARIQKNLLNAQIKAYEKFGAINFADALGLIADNDNMFEGLEIQLNKEIANASNIDVTPLQKAFAKTFGNDDLVSQGLQKSIMSAFLNATGGIETVNQQLIVAGSTLRDFGTTMVETFGENGAVVGALSSFSASMVEFGPKLAATFKTIDDATIKGTGVFSEEGTEIMTKGISAQSAGLLKHAAKAELVGSVIGQMGSLMKADSDRRIAMVDQNIEAEKRLDGKSAGSLAKIAAMEKKKEALQRKSFETQKKIQMAQVIASTAAAVMQTMAASGVGFFATPLAMVVAAMGAAQLAIIQKTKFNGGSSEAPAVQNTALSIGGRGNSVDVSQGASAGETAYLRGAKGSGTSANNFTPGGAMGRKGYADGGMLVGERGPEVVTKEEIIPNYALGKGGTTNVNFTISAIDGQSVQNMLNDQQGNIIQMIRDAANDNGEPFLETVDTPVYNGSGG